MTNSADFDSYLYKDYIVAEDFEILEDFELIAIIGGKYLMKYI